MRDGDTGFDYCLFSFKSEMGHSAVGLYLPSDAERRDTTSSASIWFGHVETDAQLQLDHHSVP